MSDGKRVNHLFSLSSQVIRWNNLVQALKSEGVYNSSVVRYLDSKFTKSKSLISQFNQNTTHNTHSKAYYLEDMCNQTKGELVRRFVNQLMETGRVVFKHQAVIMEDYGVEVNNDVRVWIKDNILFRVFGVDVDNYYEPHRLVGFSVYECTNDKCPGKKVIPVVKGKDGFTKMRNSDMRARKYFEKFKAIADYVGYYKLVFFVFTLPPELWDIDDKKFVRIVKETIMEYYGGEVFAICNVHVWHSDSPLRGFYPHVHLVVLPVTIELKNGKYKFVALDYYIDVKRLRKIYKRKLNYDGEVNIHVRYVDLRNVDKIVHHLRYNMRSPVYDLEVYFSILYNYRELVDVDRIVREKGELIKHFMKYRNRTRPLMLMAKAKRIGIDFTRLRPRVRCYFCGSEMRLVKKVLCSEDELKELSKRERIEILVKRLDRYGFLSLCEPV